MPECIGLRFDNGPKIRYFESPTSPPELGRHCIVSSKRGLEVGLVRTKLKEYPKPQGYIVREVMADDMANYKQLKDRAEELKWLLRARTKEQRLNLKVISLEFTLDESLLTVNYSAEQNVPLRLFTQELIQYTSARIEFNNVGPRDQARMFGTLGKCGTGSCSSTWLQSFNAVGIRMARDQQLPLNPEKISGPCGRLMCCLQYEHEMYQALLRDLPRKGSRACHTESGECGRIIKLHPLKASVDIVMDSGKVEEFPATEIKPATR